MVSESWESSKDRLLKLLRRRAPEEAAEMAARLEMSRAQLMGVPSTELEEAQRLQAAVWQAHLINLLERFPDTEDGLHGWVRLIHGLQGRLVDQRAMLGSGIQINSFSAPSSDPELSGTIAVPTGRRQEQAPLRGRSELVAKLVTQFWSASGDDDRVHVLHGLGGAGKSSIALEVAWEIRHSDGTVWWIPATDARRVTMHMLILARRLGLSRVEVGRPDAADLVWQRLSEYQTPWLLIFDNADDIDVFSIDGAPVRDGTGWIRPIERPAGMALVTTRHGHSLDWGSWCRLHPVPMLPPALGAQVLLDETGPGSGTQGEAEMLSERLGGLPLALRLAGSYLAQSQQMPSVFADSDRARTFTGYLELIEDKPLEQSFPSQLRVQVPDQEARQMLGRTWELSLDLLERRGHKSARALLKLLACFADAPIPYGLLLTPSLLTESEMFSSYLQGREIWETLQALSDTGLIDLSTPESASDEHEEEVLVLRLHPLVRDASRPKRNQDRHLGTAVALLVDGAHGGTIGLPEDPSRWPLWQILAPHSLHLLDALSDLPNISDEVKLGAANAAYMSARHLGATGAYRQADRTYRTILDLRRQLLGPRHQDTLNAGYGVARMAAAQGHYEEAVREFQNVLNARKKILGVDHPDTLNARYGLARMAAAQGHYRHAEDTYRQILRVSERTLGADHPETLRSRFGIARMAAEQGRFSDAEAIYRTILADQERRTYLPSFFERVEDDEPGYLEAKTVYREVLAVEERVLGPDQPDGLTIRYAIARMAAAQGRYGEAEQAYREVHAVEEATLGPAHPDTLTTRHWIGRMAHARGRHSEAEGLLRQVLTQRQHVLGANHPHTLTTRYWLARVLAAQGRHDAAASLLRQVLIARQRVLSTDHPHIAQARATLQEVQDNGSQP
ncbi:tetratricopeptide repeat protein [Actinomadura luteofluorescens]|uniref:tetratricopeptide repeat protein n=1 Tax=Actinomadura luteofluorescens TaxID=46163 RepID=UPI0021645FBA|nr:tetratricopeptide repeat protein [Actinomadura glauciflava]